MVKTTISYNGHKLYEAAAMTTRACGIAAAQPQAYTIAGLGGGGGLGPGAAKLLLDDVDP